MTSARATRALRCAALAILCSAAAVFPARAQGFTLGDIFERMRAGEAIVGFAAAHPQLDARITVLESYMRSQGAMGMGLDSLGMLYSGLAPEYATVLRWNRDAFSRDSVATRAVLPPGFKDSLVQLNIVAHGTLQRELEARIGADSLNVLYRPVDQFLDDVLRHGVARNGETLRRFAVKYGPDSPHLNLLEAGLNYAGQLLLPGVFLGSSGGPSPWEMVAAYRTTDLTVSSTATQASKLRVVTSAQLGMRWYNFAVGCGEGSQVHQLLHPCHAAAGAFVMGPADTPLAQLWHDGQRAGAYGAWGNYHVGFVLGQEKRVVFGLDTQVLPYIF